MQERQHKRYPVRLACEISYPDRASFAETLNVSCGGAAIVLAEPPAVGDVLNVSLFLTQDGIEDAKHAPFECAASVRWTKLTDDNRQSVGMQFLSPASDQKKLLDYFLTQIDE